MTKEFENLLELLKSTDKGTFFLGLQVAKNFKKEFLAYFGRSVVEVRKTMEHKIKLDLRMSENYFANTGVMPEFSEQFKAFVRELHRTFEDFAEDWEFFNPKLPENMQCGGYYRLKKMISEKQTLKKGDLQFVSYPLRQHLCREWSEFLKLQPPKDKTITILPDEQCFIHFFDDI